MSQSEYDNLRLFTEFRHAKININHITQDFLTPMKFFTINIKKYQPYPSRLSYSNEFLQHNTKNHHKNAHYSLLKVFIRFKY